MSPKQKSADPVRLLNHLWRGRNPVDSRPRQGPKPGLSVDRLVTSALGIADREGLPALTIRRVAEALGVAPMSIYTYVAHKGELLELMIDAVCLELGDFPPGSDWREGVESIARENLALNLRHPWLVEISFAERPPLGPGVIGKYERELGVFEGLGLSDLEMDAALSYVLHFVTAAAREQIQAARLRQVAANSNDDWWQASEAALIQLMPPGAYPLAERVGSAAGAYYGGAADAGFAYTFGLQRVLDGLERLIESDES